MSKVVIIGGGVIGQFSAYFLSKSGHNVTVIDDKPKMTPASEGNCGLVTPSHIMPLNSYNAILDGVKWLGKKDAPLSIKPQFDRRFISWFIQFTLSSNANAIKKAIEIRHQLLQQSISLYNEFFESEQPKSEWNKRGLLYICHESKSLDHYRHEIDLHENYGMKSRIVDSNEAYQIEPSLAEGVIGGAFMEMDGWLNPTELLEDLKRINSKNGVNYENASVSILKAKGNKVVSPDIYESFDELILAAGAKTPILADQVGVRLPVLPGKGYNLTAKTTATSLNVPIYMVERRVVATPWKNKIRIGSTMEFAGYDLSLNEKRISALKRAAKEYINLNFDDFNLEPWAGWRPMKDNGIPIIERNSKYKNLTIATGHSMVGLSMAPATGYLVNEIVNSK